MWAKEKIVWTGRVLVSSIMEGLGLRSVSVGTE